MSDRRQIVLATFATAIAVAALMIWVDHPLALFMAQYRKTMFVNVFEIVTDLANSAIWYAVALVGILLAWRQRKLDGSPAAHALYTQRLRAALFVIASMIASGLLINLIKVIVGRSRPKMLVNEGIADYTPFARWYDDCSFPSGHSQSIWAAMIALAWIFPRWRVPLLLFAVVVSSSRVIVGAHYASDVIAGAFFAFAVALPMRRRFERDGTRIKL
jgi:membrane-associated phospholipid phosphatase